MKTKDKKEGSDLTGILDFKTLTESDGSTAKCDKIK